MHPQFMTSPLVVVTSKVAVVVVLAVCLGTLAIEEYAVVWLFIQQFQPTAEDCELPIVITNVHAAEEPETKVPAVAPAEIVPAEHPLTDAAPE